MRDNRDVHYPEQQATLESELERQCAEVTFAAQHLDADFERSVVDFARGMRAAGANSGQTVGLLEKCLSQSRVAQLDAADSLWIYERAKQWTLSVF